MPECMLEALVINLEENGYVDYQRSYDKSSNYKIKINNLNFYGIMHVEENFDWIMQVENFFKYI